MPASANPSPAVAARWPTGIIDVGPGMNLDELQRALLDPTAPIPGGWPAGAFGVLLLFLVPIGGGIPAGVLMARDRGLPIVVVPFLYFVSDVILAFVFEPILRVTIAVCRAIPPLRHVGRALSASIRRTAARYGTTGGPFALIMVSFGVDPMTGRAAAAAAGHGFVPGWAIAIAGDMLYFGVLMISTLWLHDVLGDERLTIGVVLVLMLVLPSLVRRLRRPAPGR